MTPHGLSRRALLAALPVVASGLARAAEAPVKLGSVLSLTGDASYIGDAMQKTLRLYVERANAAGGVLGRPLTLVQYDDGSDAGQANSFAKRLTDSDGVDAVIGGNTSGNTMAMLPVINRAGVPFFSLAGGSEIVTPVKKWVFKTPPTDRMMAERVMEDMVKRGYDKIGLLTETGGYGQSARKQSLALAGPMHLDLVGDETFGPKDSDITPQLLTLSHRGAKAVFVVGTGGGPAIIARNLKQLGLSMQLYQAGAANSEDFIRQAGPAADGNFVVGPAFIIYSQLPGSDPQKQGAAAYAKAYADRWQLTPNTYGGSACDAIQILLQAMQRAGSTDKAKVLAAIEQTSNYVGVQGIFTMTPTDHLGSKLDSLRIFTIKTGSFALSEPPTQ